MTKYFSKQHNLRLTKPSNNFGEDIFMMPSFSKRVEIYPIARRIVIRINSPIGEPDEWSEEVSAIQTATENDIIHIYINSPGGSVVDGLAIYDISKIIEAPIRTICIGLAASMGAVLMLMGNERCALKHSRLMFHEVSGGAVGKLSDLKIQFKLAEDLQKDIYAIIKDKTQLENIDIILEKDNWFTSEEALNYKIINKIL